MGTIDGVPVTEDMIEARAVEAEQGYDVNQLRRRGRRAMGSAPARVVPVRIDPALLKTVDERAAADGTNRSEVIRAAIRAYVA